jgi:trans-aconitate methyltransferase
MSTQPHPLYSDEALVRRVTQDLMAQQHHIFQLFQFPGPATHSQVMYSALSPHSHARILSVGCGIGGMERFWQRRTPTLDITLLNTSQAQLDLCKAEGAKVLADGESWRSSSPFDVVLFAHSLGHMDFTKALDNALENLTPKGKLFLIEPCNGDAEFNRRMHYRSPFAFEVWEFALTRGLQVQVQWLGGIPRYYAVPLYGHAVSGVFVLQR